MEILCYVNELRRESYPWRQSIWLTCENRESQSCCTSRTNYTIVTITSDPDYIWSSSLVQRNRSWKTRNDRRSSWISKLIQQWQSFHAKCNVITHLPFGRQSYSTDVASVQWDTIPPEVVERVIARRRVFDSSWGFCIEDEDLKSLIVSFQGTVDSIMGLPMHTVTQCIGDVLHSDEGR